jgi:hypothetical protein
MQRSQLPRRKTVPALSHCYNQWSVDQRADHAECIIASTHSERLETIGESSSSELPSESGNTETIGITSCLPTMQELYEEKRISQDRCVVFSHRSFEFRGHHAFEATKIHTPSLCSLDRSTKSSASSCETTQGTLRRSLR